MALDTDPRDARIARLEARVEAALRRAGRLDLWVAELTRENADLKRDIAELRARLNANSQNSSAPPSSDGPGVKRPATKAKGRKRGGQPGHEGAERRLLTPDRIVHHRPRRCRRCHGGLLGDDPHASKFQVLEMPKIQPDVTEHRAHALTCGGCGTVTRATIPARVRRHGFGPRLSAFVAYLSGRCRLSKRQIAELCEDAFGTPISLGAVCAIEKDVSEALASPVKAAAEAVQKQPVVNVDETGWREEKRLAWLWVAVTGVAIVFLVARSRGSVAAKELLGKYFRGHAVSDRWGGYNWIATSRRQLCWAHLRRDFVGMIERGGIGADIATRLLANTDKMFAWWAQVRDGKITRRLFQKRMKRVRGAVSRLLRDARARAEKKTAGMCNEMLMFEPAFWTFVDHEGIEPTNNAAERAVRHAVLWRKGSFGNDSAVGSRFTERILTAVATVRLRGGDVLGYLTDTCTQYRATGTSPSLLSVPQRG